MSDQNGPEAAAEPGERNIVREGCCCLPLGLVAAAVLGLLLYLIVYRDAAEEHVAAARPLCTPQTLLEIRRPDLYALRSRQVREGGGTRGPFFWSIRSGGEVVTLRSTPLVARTTVHSIDLHLEDEWVARLKYVVVTDPYLLPIAPAEIVFSCSDVAHAFYLDLLAHEFSMNR